MFSQQRHLVRQVFRRRVRTQVSRVVTHRPQPFRQIRKPEHRKYPLRVYRLNVSDEVVEIGVVTVWNACVARPAVPPRFGSGYRQPTR